MILRTRHALAHAAVAAALTAGALAAFGSPAYADDTADLAVTLSGTTLAATTSGKISDVTVTNHGPSAATGVVVVFDVSALDSDRVKFEVPDAKACETAGDKVSCGVVDIPAGQALDLGITLTRKGDTGKAGKLTVSVKHAGTDTVAGNNAATADVTVGESGPDLFVYAPDVPFDVATGKVGTVTPGGTAKLKYFVGNFGDVAVTGVKVTVTLPKHATFAEVEPDCVYNSAKTSVTCTYNDLPLVPADEDTNPDDDILSSVAFFNVLKIAGTAPAGSHLADGVVAVEPLIAKDEGPGVQRKAAHKLPANAVAAVAKDVDNTDNSDEFIVQVAAATGGTGGGAGGGLPVTGVQVGVIGGVGLAVLVTGGVLMLLARRRRIVLVTPTDETPTA